MTASPTERLHPEKPLCRNCGWEFSEHDPKSGSCYNGGTGEDATGYEPRSADWQPPPPPIDFDSTGWDDL